MHPFLFRSRAAGGEGHCARALVLAALAMAASAACGGAVEGGLPPEGDASVDALTRADVSSGTDAVAEHAHTDDADASRTSDSSLVPPACTAFSDGGSPPECAGIDHLVLSAPVVQTVDGGMPGPGDTAIVTVLLSDPPNGPSLGYPAVCFASDTTGISFGSNGPAEGLFEISPGASAKYAIGVTFASSLAPGTVVSFAAQTTVLNGGCSNGSQLLWDYTLP
jgi:hypothetical protein